MRSGNPSGYPRAPLTATLGGLVSFFDGGDGAGVRGGEPGRWVKVTGAPVAGRHPFTEVYRKADGDWEVMPPGAEAVSGTTAAAETPLRAPGGGTIPTDSVVYAVAEPAHPDGPGWLMVGGGGGGTVEVVRAAYDNTGAVGEFTEVIVQRYLDFPNCPVPSTWDYLKDTDPPVRYAARGCDGEVLLAGQFYLVLIRTGQEQPATQCGDPMPGDPAAPAGLERVIVQGVRSLGVIKCDEDGVGRPWLLYAANLAEREAP